MDTIRNRLISLEEVPADRHLVEELYARKAITPEARAAALNMLYPARNWGLWISRLLLAVGTALVLSGIVYFYAFNWAAIPDAIKIGSAEGALILAVLAALFFGLNRTTGQAMATASATLVGVFLAVFGQVYQTGADAWELFGLWAVLIIPWAIITDFAPLWALWLIVTNVALTLFWQQVVQLDTHHEAALFPLLGAFNAALLGLREYFAVGRPWLSGRWTRSLPAFIALVCATVPGIALIDEWARAESVLTGSALCGIAMLGGFYCVYRYFRPDMPTLAATILCGCILVEFAVFRLMDVHMSHGEAGQLLLQALFTVALFTGAVVWLRSLTKRLEVRHG